MRIFTLFQYFPPGDGRSVGEGLGARHPLGPGRARGLHPDGVSHPPMGVVRPEYRGRIRAEKRNHGASCGYLASVVTAAARDIPEGAS
jgi:hypothetical protein